MLHMPPGPTPQAPSSISGGKEPAKHPGFIVPQKEGTNYLPTLWSAQGKNRSQWVERVGNGGGGGARRERKPQDTFQSFSSNLEVGQESSVLM